MRYYYNQHWQVLEERKEVSGTEDPDPLHQYVWHPYYIDALAVRYYDADTDNNLAENNDGALYYCHDANFNVTAITNASGTVLERYAYSPYGNVTVLDANFAADGDQISDIGNTHLYTGRERDPETGLQLNRHRYYAWHLGRWMNRDPILYRGGMNLYGYVGGFPTQFVDPLGYASKKPKPGGGGGLWDWNWPWSDIDEDVNYCFVTGNVLTCVSTSTTALS